MSTPALVSTDTPPAALGGPATFPDGLPLARPSLGDAAAAAQRLQQVVASGQLTNGRLVRELEAAVAKRLGVAEVVAVASCTHGLLLVLQQFGVRGGRVAVPGFTFAASAHAIHWAGAEPVWVDCEPARLTADPGDVKAVAEDVDAIMATHVYGSPCDVEGLEAIATDAGVPLLYDAAHALGSARDGRPIGRFGTCEVFSLSPTKVVVAGEGGLVTTDDADLAAQLRVARDYGNPGDYDCLFPGLNARMSELHAAVALESFAVLDDAVARRGTLVETFADAVADLPGLRVIRPADGDTSTHKDMTLVVDAPAFGVDAATLQWTLKAEGIDSRRYFHPPVHRQRAYAGRNGHRALPVTDHLAGCVLSPPLWTSMSEGQVEAVAATIGRIHRHAAALRQAPR